MEDNIKQGDSIEIETADGKFCGILMERPELADDKHLVIKLSNGYNIGIKKDRIRNLRVIAQKKSEGVELALSPHEPCPGKKSVSIIATGGTIASRVDHITGGVHSAFTAEELISAIPELKEIANIRGIQVLNKFSEDMAPGDWVRIAKAVADEIKNGADGIVITHGTDTMGYTAAALAFMLKSPVPVILTGAQRSSDRGSSDAGVNLISSVYLAANMYISGVYVVMHSNSSDGVMLIHPATKVRKFHSSRRDAFKTVNSSPIGRIENKKIEFFHDVKPRKGAVELDALLEERVFLLKYFPGLNPDIIEKLIELDYKGIVIEGTGLGHVSESLLDSLKTAVDSGISIAMTSQTSYGRVNMNVYSTGRRLLSIGAIPCGDMLPETAYVKLMWVLGHTNDRGLVKEMMLTNYAGEIEDGGIIC